MINYFKIFLYVYKEIQNKKNYENVRIDFTFSSIDPKGCVHFPNDPDKIKYSSVTHRYYAPSTKTFRIK